MIPPIQTILVPLDLTEHAESIVEWAIEWARMKRSSLVLLHVLAPVHAYAPPAFVDPASYDEHYARAREAARQRLMPLALRAQAGGVDASIRIRIGFPAEEILTLARATGTGLIILGTHGRKGLAHVVLGSTAEKVVRLAECPVFVVKERRSAPSREKTAQADTAHIG